MIILFTSIFIQIIGYFCPIYFSKTIWFRTKLLNHKMIFIPNIKYSLLKNVKDLFLLYRFYTAQWHENDVYNGICYFS